MAISLSGDVVVLFGFGPMPGAGAAGLRNWDRTRLPGFRAPGAAVGDAPLGDRDATNELQR